MMGKYSNLKNTWIGVVTVLYFICIAISFLPMIYAVTLYISSSRLFDSTKAMAFSNVPSRDWVSTSTYLLLTLLLTVFQERTMSMLVWASFHWDYKLQHISNFYLRGLLWAHFEV